MPDQVAKLEGLLKEEKKGSHEAKLAIVASFLSVLVVKTKLEEEKTTHSRELNNF